MDVGPNSDNAPTTQATCRVGTGDDNLAGIFQRLGSFGTAVIQTAKQIGWSLGETLGILERSQIDVEPLAAARDWGRVSTSEALEPEITALGGDEYIPHSLFVTSDIPWKEKFAYQVTIFGRDRATGRFKNQAFDMTVGREMTIDEIITLAHTRFGGYEGSKMSEVFDAQVTGAWKSGEVEW